MKKLTVKPRYDSPSSLLWLTGHANEATVVVQGVEIMALVDTRSQISTLTKGLRILQLGGLLHLKGTGSIMILYKGYMDHLVMDYDQGRIATVWGCLETGTP